MGCLLYVQIDLCSVCAIAVLHARSLYIGPCHKHTALYSTLLLSGGHLSPNNSQKTPIARPLGRAMGIFSELEVWPKFYLRSCCAECNIMLYYVALYRECIVYRLGKAQRQPTVLRRPHFKYHKVLTWPILHSTPASQSGRWRLQSWTCSTQSRTPPSIYVGLKYVTSSYTNPAWYSMLYIYIYVCVCVCVCKYEIIIPSIKKINVLTHWGRMMHILVSKLGYH